MRCSQAAPPTLRRDDHPAPPTHCPLGTGPPQRRSIRTLISEIRRCPRRGRVPRPRPRPPPRTPDLHRRAAEPASPGLRAVVRGAAADPGRPALPHVAQDQRHRGQQPPQADRQRIPGHLLKAGVWLADKGLFSEGESAGETVLAQTGRRTTRLDMPSFTIDSEQCRRHWRQLLLALNGVSCWRTPIRACWPTTCRTISRPQHRAHRLADDAGQPRLAARPANRRRAPHPRSPRPVRNDEAAERNRSEIEYALRAGRAASRPRRVRAAP